jgi:dynein heavy chain
VRSLREDRSVQASIQFIKETLGEYFVVPVNDQIQEFFNETQNNVPVLFLLSPGADANGMIDEFARNKKQPPTNKVSMGEEQDIPARELID